MKLYDIEGNRIKDKKVVFGKCLNGNLKIEKPIMKPKEFEKIVLIGEDSDYGSVFKAHTSYNNEFILYFGRLEDKKPKDD